MAQIAIESRKSKPNQSHQNKTNQIFQTQVSLTQFTLQTNFAFYSIKIRLEMAELAVGEKILKLSPNHLTNSLKHLEQSYFSE